MNKIKFYSGKQIPLEMHKAKVIQKISIRSVDDRLNYITEAGNNQFLLKNEGIFLDMLTDSGVNAISDKQQAAGMAVDDAYAGSKTYYILEDKIKEIFDMDYFIPAHQGRACENILMKALVKQGDFIPMNYHFATTKEHITINGGKIEELVCDDALKCDSDNPFKGNINLDKLKKFIKKVGKENIPFLRFEAGTNLIGGQPISLKNIKDVSAICKENDILTVLDASLLPDNLYFIKTREEEYKNSSIREITREIAAEMDIIYFSARKLSFSRGGGICLRDEHMKEKLLELVTLHEGFLTYGGISIADIAAMIQGLDETMDFDMISQGPMFIKYMVDELDKIGVPVVKPAGGLGCHIDARAFLPNVPNEQYPASALTAAIYLVSGVRTMEKGTFSEDRNADGSENISDVEFVRCAMPRRVFTRSHIDFVVDRIHWLYDNRELVGGLKIVKEPKTLRGFLGRLAPTSDWQQKLVTKFKIDFPNGY